MCKWAWLPPEIESLIGLVLLTATDKSVNCSFDLIDASFLYFRKTTRQPVPLFKQPSIILNSIISDDRTSRSATIKKSKKKEKKQQPRTLNRHRCHLAFPEPSNAVSNVNIDLGRQCFPTAVPAASQIFLSVHIGGCVASLYLLPLLQVVFFWRYSGSPSHSSLSTRSLLCRHTCSWQSSLSYNVFLLCLVFYSVLIHCEAAYPKM